MKLYEFKNILTQNPTAQVRFLLPTGEFAPRHVHVTEVARIDKRFIDCGGTIRTDALCRLQTWFSSDVEHRLVAGKLLKIFAKAENVLQTDDLDLDVEHEVEPQHRKQEARPGSHKRIHIAIIPMDDR